jgi:hypothetical protein
MILKRIRQHEEAMERIIVRKTRSHYYNISIRTRTVKRELKARADAGPVIPVGSGKERESA